ncbi:class I SAM-dependent methyltransferase [Hydrogenobacter sp. T-2]|uniref:class I SAM-dependent methyltransferase n=1 Tax=Pampinifervens diazotrophicum TaxID=1632018 RepID=UPI002B259B98|nr:class I SAM-dependent methyltransferase [Hydrogenobacter sp. T-2]WPM32949.1 class I SAM-dependent methyltransferase [Hydrogenobacter sp. T-2]
MVEKIITRLNEGFSEGLSLELPDGRCIGKGLHRIKVLKEDVLKEVLKDPEMGFCEAYMRGDISIDGDLEKVLIACMEYVESEGKRGKREVFSSLLRWILKGIGLIKKVEGKEVRRHYDLGNEFYQLWLDKSMTYSCAFFSDKNMSLEEAQSEKRRIIYEKLQLKEGDRLLDIGCGWGSIILETAQLYGVQSTGITLSKNQYEFVKERIKSLGLEGKAEVYLMHYEDLPKIGRKFNKVVSVGMFEHVGKGRHRKFFEVVREIMEDGGLFLLHTIGKVHTSSQSRWIRKYIFPGGYLPSIEEVIRASKGLGFNLIDIDNWRLHYYLTLKEWKKRFLTVRDWVVKRYGEEFYRMWELYLTSSAVSFYRGSNHLFQFLLSKGVINTYPVMRRYIGQPLLSS